MEIGIEIEGISPLMLHAFTDEAQLEATDGGRSAAASGDRGTPLEQATKHLYIGSKKQLIIPGPMLFACVINGGKFHKAGTNKITTQRSSLIPACVSINEIEIDIIHKEPWTVDTRPVRIPATGGRILRHRPLFHDWKLVFTVELDTAEMNEKLFRQIVDSAGKKVGLGDFRPMCKGPFGRFTVTRWSRAIVPLEEKREEKKARKAA